mgnify:CR=1 FL=1
MNREELEKMFDEFWEDWAYWDWSSCEIDRWIMFWFITDTIISEVLKSLLENEYENFDEIEYELLDNHIKQKAKELYNITL